MSPFACTTRNSPTVGRHPTVLEVQNLAHRAARCHLPVLITGETGTGKELLARAIHAQSPRSDGPFVVVDCGVLSRDVARSELFGHLRGSFTGAFENRCGLVKEARGGTLFLDEVGDLPGDLQPHLLRLLQEGEFRPVGDSRIHRADVRLVAATHRDLKQQVLEGRFREDLFYRLDVIHLHLPPLRDRRSDIPLLIEHFVAKSQENGLRIRPLSPEVRMLLEGYDWPGNVRELTHVISRALLLAEGEQVYPGDLPPHIQASGTSEADLYELSYKEARHLSLDRFTREYLHRALLRTGGNVSQAARESGIGRQYFQVRMAEHGFRADRYRGGD